MEGTFGNLRIYSGGSAVAPGTSVEMPALGREVPQPSPSAATDPVLLANRELVRPPTYRRRHQRTEPFSAEWFDDLKQQRYARHTRWLDAALEFGRHPGESVLLIGPGVGTDAVRFLRAGTEITIAVADADRPDLIRENLSRSGFAARMFPLTGEPLPVADGTFDVVVWNGLYPLSPTPAIDDLFRVLKCGGKVIGLFPARYDAGYWQDLILPLQHWYWRRPPDPTTSAKTTRKELIQCFPQFTAHRVLKRHLRRSELPHLWRTLPLVFLERLIGRVLVFKAFKPLTAASVARGGEWERGRQGEKQAA
jgi:SAM-dependent methyltransferase